MSIVLSNGEIISKRLCIVCAGEGKRFCIHDHEYTDDHWMWTFYALEGWFVDVENCGSLFGYHHNGGGYFAEPFLHEDYFRMAVAVGGFACWENPDGPAAEAEGTGRVINAHTLDEAATEAVTRAYMAQLYASPKLPWGGPKERGQG